MSKVDIFYMLKYVPLNNNKIQQIFSIYDIVKLLNFVTSECDKCRIHNSSFFKICAKTH